MALRLPFRTTRIIALVTCMTALAAAPHPVAATQAPVSGAAAMEMPLVPARAIEGVHRYFSELAETDRFSGAVLIAHAGKTLFEGAYGLADLDALEPVTADTRFNLGSIDKFITRIAIFQLIESGKLALDQRVGEILPSYPNQVVRAEVSVEHLLNMKSGIPLSPQTFLERRASLWTTEDYLDLFAREELRFKPGSRSEYSNGAYVVLGKIIEQVSGMRYDDYVRHHITGPLGMSRTSLDSATEGEGYATGYTQGMPNETGGRTGPPQRNSDYLAAHGSSMGGGYSTVRDFAKLAAALHSGTLIGRSVREDFYSRWSGFDYGSQPAGWSGGFFGVSTVFSLWNDGTTVIIFTNRDPPLARASRDAVFELLGKPVEQERAG